MEKLTNNIEIKKWIKDRRTDKFNEIIEYLKRVKDTESLIAFEAFLEETKIENRFKRIVNMTEQKIKTRIELGIGIVEGSNLSILLNDGNMRIEFRDFITDCVIAHINMNECVKGLTKMVSVSRYYEKDLNWVIKDIAYNIYQQYNSAYNAFLGKEFGYKYFVYQGGLLAEGSRDFCREHNNHIYSIDEADTWKDWSPSTAKFITAFTQKDIYDVPSYMNYPGYDPLIDRGGYGCRHSLGWIPDDKAFEMRPELKIDSSNNQNCIPDQERT